MAKIIDFALEDVNSISEIIESFPFQPVELNYSSDRLSVHCHQTTTADKMFFCRTFTDIFNFRVPQSRMQYNFKVEIAMQTETNCINYGGYMFTGLATMYQGAWLICIGCMTVRIGAVNMCYYGAWKLNLSNYTWTVFNETGQENSPFTSDAILTIMFDFKMNETSGKYVCNYSIKANGTAKVTDQNIVHAAIPDAFLNQEWSVHLALLMVDHSIGNYYRWDVLKVVWG